MRIGITALISLALARGIWAADIISTDGFSNCGKGDSPIEVQNVDISFDRTTNTITFDVLGTSKESQDVTASLLVTAYGVTVYNQTFDPCADSTKVEQLCPGKILANYQKKPTTNNQQSQQEHSPQRALSRSLANMPRKFLQLLTAYLISMGRRSSYSTEKTVRRQHVYSHP